MLLASEQPPGIAASIAALPVDPSRSRTNLAFHPIVNAKGADRAPQAPFIVHSLNASLVA